MRSTVIQGSFIGGRPRVAAPPGVAQARMPVVQARGATQIIPLEPGQINLAGSVGRPLPTAFQSKMETIFGEDFSDVRIHSGPLEAEADGMGARVAAFIPPPAKR